MKRTWLRKHVGALATALALAFPAAGPARTASSALQVSADVRPSAAISFEAKTSGVAVTPEDIAAGYVYVPASSLLTLKTAGLAPAIVVEFMPLEGVFRSVEVVATGVDDLAAGGPSAAPQRRAPAGQPEAQKVVALSYRFNLAASAAPGIYATPMTVTISL